MSAKKALLRRSVVVSALAAAFFAVLTVGGCELWEDEPVDDGAFVPGTQFNPKITYSTFTDERDGKKYRSVKIGNQTWMAENLNYVTDSNSWCYEDKNPNCAKYGRLYHRNVAVAACPAGWHLPDTAEWSELERVAGGSKAAPRLRSAKAWRHWNYVIPGTDNFGFSALPGGSRSGFGSYGDEESAGFWWTSTDGGDGGMLYGGRIMDIRIMSCHDEHVIKQIAGSATGGLSIRCVQDDLIGTD